MVCNKGNKGCQGMQARFQNNTVCVVPENIHPPWRALVLFALDPHPPGISIPGSACQKKNLVTVNKISPMKTIIILISKDH